MYFTIFDSQNQLLGVLDSEETLTLQFYLTTAGRAALEQEIADWQMNGIPVIQIETLIEDGLPKRIVGTTRVPCRSKEGVLAFTRWAHQQGLILSTFPREHLSSMKKLLKLPLTPSEIQTLAQLLAITPINKQPEWEKALEKATG